MSESTDFYGKALDRALFHSKEFLSQLDQDPVDVNIPYEEMKKRWQWELQDEGLPASQVIDELALSAREGLVHNQSGRFFAFVIGGSHPSGIAADWLTSAWDQNAGLYVATPASSIVEEIAGAWLKSLLSIPEDASFSFVTGGQMANFTCLNAARNHLFHQAGWDIETKGFYGAPRIRVIAGDQKHSTIIKALRLLGFGSDQLIQIPTDTAGRIDPDGVKRALEENPSVPALVILQAGEIHSGAFDDFEKIIPIAHAHQAWVHIDGAFGLWAAASPAYAHLMKGAALADSWTVDGHKWLNVPYDSGYAFVAHPQAHFRSLNQSASYLSEDDRARDQMHWTPELSRRARGFATYAVLRELGRKGVQHAVDSFCAHAKALVDGIQDHPQVQVMTYPIINQGMVRFLDKNPNANDADHDFFTQKVVDRINASGVAFFQPSTWKGKKGMRISVSGWRTNEEDVRRTIQAILEAMEN